MQLFLSMTHNVCWHAAIDALQHIAKSQQQFVNKQYQSVPCYCCSQKIRLSYDQKDWCKWHFCTFCRCNTVAFMIMSIDTEEQQHLIQHENICTHAFFQNGKLQNDSNQLYFDVVQQHASSLLDSYFQNYILQPSEFPVTTTKGQTNITCHYEKWNNN